MTSEVEVGVRVNWPTGTRLEGTRGTFPHVFHAANQGTGSQAQSSTQVGLSHAHARDADTLQPLMLHVDEYGGNLGIKCVCTYTAHVHVYNAYIHMPDPAQPEGTPLGPLHPSLVRGPDAAVMQSSTLVPTDAFPSPAVSRAVLCCAVPSRPALSLYDAS